MNSKHMIDKARYHEILADAVESVEDSVPSWAEVHTSYRDEQGRVTVEFDFTAVDDDVIGETYGCECTSPLTLDQIDTTTNQTVSSVIDDHWEQTVETDNYQPQALFDGQAGVGHPLADTDA